MSYEFWGIGSHLQKTDRRGPDKHGPTVEDLIFEKPTIAIRTIYTQMVDYMYRWSAKQGISAQNEHHRYIFCPFHVAMVSGK